MAIRSSTIAKAAKNIFKLTGTLLSNNDIAARANAISVAMGIAHPAAVSAPEFNAKNIAAGTIAPPMAHSIGIIAFFGDDSAHYCTIFYF